MEKHRIYFRKKSFSSEEDMDGVCFGKLGDTVYARVVIPYNYYIGENDDF